MLCRFSGFSGWKRLGDRIRAFEFQLNAAKRCSTEHIFATLSPGIVPFMHGFLLLVPISFRDLTQQKPCVPEWTGFGDMQKGALWSTFLQRSVEESSHSFDVTKMNAKLMLVTLSFCILDWIFWGRTLYLWKYRVRSQKIQSKKKKSQKMSSFWKWISKV